MSPVVRKGLQPKGQTSYVGMMALAAARAGDKEDALRLWTQRTNLDRRMPHGLESMVQAGLRDELVRFYEAMAEADPASIHPPRMIEHLRASK